MYLCYVDESGTSDIPGNTSHYVLVGISAPVWHWKDADREIRNIKMKYGLSGVEMHTAWMVRYYKEQKDIPNFKNLDHQQRRSAVTSARNAEILRLQRAGNPKQLRQTKKNFGKTDAYIHLTHKERMDFIKEVAECVSNWGFARIFAECVDKIYFDPSRYTFSVDEQAFEQVVSRFETFLGKLKSENDHKNYGLLIHDNNPTLAKKHTNLMKRFHAKGTLWTEVQNIIETPLFVDSQLTSMVQVADLCGYALRRYCEKGEEELFDLVYTRAERLPNNTVVSVRHFSEKSCTCKICNSRKS